MLRIAGNNEDLARAACEFPFGENRMRRHVGGCHAGSRNSAGEPLMAILVNQQTRLLCQGITGWAGTITRTA